jgi:hypothetical protein
VGEYLGTHTRTYTHTGLVLWIITPIHAMPKIRVFTLPIVDIFCGYLLCLCMSQIVIPKRSARTL